MRLSLIHFNSHKKFTTSFNCPAWIFPLQNVYSLNKMRETTRLSKRFCVCAFAFWKNESFRPKHGNFGVVSNKVQDWCEQGDRLADTSVKRTRGTHPVKNIRRSQSLMWSIWKIAMGEKGCKGAVAKQSAAKLHVWGTTLCSHTLCILWWSCLGERWFLRHIYPSTFPQTTLAYSCWMAARSVLFCLQYADAISSKNNM